MVPPPQKGSKIVEFGFVNFLIIKSMMLGGKQAGYLYKLKLIPEIRDLSLNFFFNSKNSFGDIFNVNFFVN